MAPTKHWPKVILTGAIAAFIVAALVQLLLPYDKTTTLEVPSIPLPRFNSTIQSSVCIALANGLPDSVFSDHHSTYQKSVNSYWSQNAGEKRPTCIVRPANVQEVATTVQLLKAEFDHPGSSIAPFAFAVRSGGHSPEAGFASNDDGVVVDLSLLSDVTLSTDRQSASIGVGARWSEVSSKLDSMGLAIVGGRLGDVGVGGLVLGGGISFFSPRFGMVCDNIDEYEIVLANGTITHATSSQHADLWRALKGGSGNFGIVTRVKARTFPVGDIWGGSLIWAGWQAPKVIKAFFEFNQPEKFDKYAAGPIPAFCYFQNLGIKLIGSTTVYTKPQKWPPAFNGFKSIWRLWSTARIQSLTSLYQYLASIAPAGKRQFQVTTTVRNDLETLNALNDIYNAKLNEVKAIQGSLWALVFQPLAASVTHKGSPNVLGLETRHPSDTVIIVLISVSWRHAGDDELVHRITREVLVLFDEYALRKGTADPFRYLNYAASGQDPIAGYGAANQRFLQDVSRAYDPEGFFQRAKQGGFNLSLD